MPLMPCVRLARVRPGLRAGGKKGRLWAEAALLRTLMGEMSGGNLPAHSSMPGSPSPAPFACARLAGGTNCWASRAGAVARLWELKGEKERKELSIRTPFDLWRAAAKCAGT